MSNDDEYDPYDRDRWRKKKKKINPFDFLGPFGKMFEDEEFMGDFQSIFDEILKSPMFRNLFEELAKQNTTNNPYVWGFSMKKGPDGKPIINPFGNTKSKYSDKSEKNFPQDTREPLVDIFEEDDVIRVIIEIPGVEKEDIDLNTTSNKMQIKATSGERKYYKKLDLPAEIIPEKTKARFKNGVLEIELLRSERKDKSEKIDIQ